MSFSTASWVSLEASITPKRPRSDSGLTFNVPASKRTKRSLSDGDKQGAGADLGSLVKQSTLYQKSASLKMPNTQTLPIRKSQSEQRNPTIDSSAIHKPQELNGESLKLGGVWSSEFTVLASGMQDYGSPPIKKVSASALLQSPPTPKEIDELFEDDGDYEMFDIGPADLQFSEPIMTFEKFFDLPTDLQTKIMGLAEVCVTGRTCKPFYKQGMLKGYMINPEWPDPACDMDIKDAMVVGDNFDFLTSAFLSRKYADVYIKTFYSHNPFSFDDPRAALWFFKGLGNNFCSLRNVTLIVTGGTERKYPSFSEDPRNCWLNESLEELWYGVFCWIQYRHEFEALTVAFRRAPDQHQLSLSLRRDVISEVMLYREKIVRKLCQFRGIKRVKILDPTCSFLNGGDRDILDIELAMQQPKDAVQTEDKRKKPLSQVLDHSRMKIEADTDRRADPDDLDGFLQECRDFATGGSEADDPTFGLTEAEARAVGWFHEDPSTHATQAPEAREEMDDEMSEISDPFAIQSQLSKKEKEKQRKKNKKKQQQRNAQNAILGQLLEQSTTTQGQQSQIRAIVSSIGVSSALPRQTPTTANRDSNANGVRNSRPQHVRNEYDRPVHARAWATGRNSGNGNGNGVGRRQQNYYGRRRHQHSQFDWWREDRNGMRWE